MKVNGIIYECIYVFFSTLIKGKSLQHFKILTEFKAKGTFIHLHYKVSSLLLYQSPGSERYHPYYVLQVSPLMPYEYQEEGMLQRLSAYLSNQDFCKPKPSLWPPEDQVTVMMANPGQSCKDACWKKGGCFVLLVSHEFDLVQSLLFTCQTKTLICLQPLLGHFTIYQLLCIYIY